MTEKTFSDSAEQQKQLSRQLLELQEAERRRIARELHDQVGQGLSLVQLHLHGMQQRIDNEGLKNELQECYALVENVIESVQKLSLDLRPAMLDDLGLIAALRWYTNQARTIGLNAIFTSNLPNMRLDPSLETTCYRIVQEALTNVVRHARARWVCVDLQQSEGCFHVTVSDNGVGFVWPTLGSGELDNACLGLLGMQERAALAGGTLEIKSIPHHGTEIHARFPLSNGSL